MTKADNKRENSYEWKNTVFYGEVSDINAGNLKSLVGVGASARFDGLSYFFCSRHEFDTSAGVLASAAKVAAIVSEFNGYYLMPKRENETDD